MDDGGVSNSVSVSDTMQRYFEELQNQIDHCYDIARKARKKGYDPIFDVEIPQALDLASRVEELVGPKDIAPKIRELTKKIGNREEVSLKIARYIGEGKEYSFSSTEKALDQAIRTGLAILTEGVLVAPLEGIADVKIGTNHDGTNYVDLYFSGPIRSAGGTGQAMSVLIADVVRRKLGIGEYKPTPNEIERYKEEIPLYKRVQHLQYTPNVDEIDLIVKHCPICVNGEGTEQEEVTGNRDLPRVESNRLRGGACLVIAEGLCLKAPKILKHVKKLKLKGWDFLERFVHDDSRKQDDTESSTTELPDIPPEFKYIEEVIAGRPVFGHPSRKGGFRLRYGRARTAGLASTAISPAAMVLSDGFIAVGTQLKMERPGKATIGTPCDEIEGPIILTYDGDLIQVSNPADIDMKSIKQIVDFGEILIPYGEFLENNALLPNASYSIEWWIQDVQQALNVLPDINTIENIRDADRKTKEALLERYDHDIDLFTPSFDDAFQISKDLKVPLHPGYNLFWHDITIADVQQLSSFIQFNGTIEENTLVLPFDQSIKDFLIELGVLHRQVEKKMLIENIAPAFLHCLGCFQEGADIKKRPSVEHFLESIPDDVTTTVSYVSKLAEMLIRERAPFRIGMRMGRPEKAAQRKMRPPPHVLFPLGNYGSNQRLLEKAAEKGEIEVEAGKRLCQKCGKNTFRIRCTCGGHADPVEDRIEIQSINISKELSISKKNLGLRSIPDHIKGVQGTISKHKTPEPLEKGILRAKHDVTVFKDGTIRFDMTDAPLTHFKPLELHVSLDSLHGLGYTHDINGDPLERQDQICELRVQDIIISTACAEYFKRVASFIDELLVRYYHMDRFYNIRKIDDLIGHLAIGLAPHTSGGSLARIIGFTDAQVCFSHPFYHAAKRRNCFSSDQRVYLYDESQKQMITSQIGAFVESYLEHGFHRIIDGFGTMKCNIPATKNLFAYSLDRTTGKLMKKRITCVIKGNTDCWIRIQTSTNRSIKVTPEHQIAVIENTGIIIKKASEIREGDKIPLATHLPSEQSLRKINLVTSVASLPESITKDILIRNAKGFFQHVLNHIGREQFIKLCQISCPSQHNISRLLQRFPLSYFLTICNNTEVSFDDLPSDATIGLRRDHVNLPAYVTDVSSLFWIIGFYSAQGWSRKTKSSSHVSFRACDGTLEEHVKTKMQSIFSLHPCHQETKLSYCSRLLHLLFTEVWNTGVNPHSKQVPTIIYQGEREAIRQFISAYFDGEGSISLKPGRITFSSVSQSLLEGIANLLLREDIVTSFLKTEKQSPAKKVFDRYLRLEKEPEQYILRHLELTGVDTYRFCDYVNPLSPKKQVRISNMFMEKPDNPGRFIKYQHKCYPAVSYSDYTFDFITKIEQIATDNEPTYCLDIEGEKLQDKAIFWHNQLIQLRCDGDEDGQMLLVDALLNFSHEYIPDKRGGKMDLPLILTTRLDPSEVDKEAHNLDCLARYPLAFYEATLRHEHPKEWEKQMDIVGGRLGTPLQYEHFGFTHDTTDIAKAPIRSRYKTLKTMMDKMKAQLELAAKIRAVDEADVAYKVIERHFLPDILGNFRAFSKQSVRCPTCNITYRRIPLNGVCRKCKGKLSLTVHEKSVKKYLEISKEIAERYQIPAYAQQRIRLVEKNIDSLFLSDKIKKTKITDFL